MNPEQWAAVDRYIGEMFIPPDPVLTDALQAIAAAGMPAHSVSSNEGKLLMLLAQMCGARNILEIGTLGGFSTIWLARALPKNGRLITLEADARHAGVASENIARAGFSDIVEVRVGPALDTLPRLAAEGRGPFDLIFIDADKQNNPDYFSWSLKLSRPGTVIVADNVIRNGAVIDAASSDPSVVGIRRFNEMVAAEERVSATAVQTVGSKGYDGFAIIRVRGRDLLQLETGTASAALGHEILPTQAGYERWAEIYDADDNPLILLEEEHLAQLLGHVAGLSVVDVGCGTGRHAARLAAAGARVTAVDFSPAMLERARAKAGAKDVTFVCHDIPTPLPLEEGAFDRVLCCLMADHVADVGALFRELRRLRRPGGSVVFSVMHPAMTLRGVQARFIDPASGRRVSPASHPHVIADYVTAAVHAGLQIVEMSEHSVDEDLVKRSERARKYMGWPLLLLMLLR